MADEAVHMGNKTQITNSFLIIHLFQAHVMCHGICLRIQVLVILLLQGQRIFNKSHIYIS